MVRLGEIFRAHGESYRRRFAERMSHDQLKAMRDIEACHTPAAGRARWACPRCGKRHFTFVGCGNRHCPACGASRARQWLRKTSALLLPGVVYHLVTFTVPSELRRVIRSHPRELLELVMQVSARVLFDLAANPRWLGGRPGATAVLHTWTRQGIYHPHVHFIVTGGGIDQQGRWSDAHPRFLVPVHALSRVFRARLRDALRQQYSALFAKIAPTAWSLPTDDALHRSARAWVVHSKPVGSGEHALRYLSGYVYCVAVSEHAILGRDRDGRYIIRYRSSRTDQPRTMRLEPHELIRRFLQHVLPSRFCKIRYYGLHHSSQRPVLKLLQAAMAFQLGQPVPDPPEEQPMAPACPDCHTPMIFEQRIPPLPLLAFAVAVGMTRGPP